MTGIHPAIITEKELTLQQLSDMLWAANGINRPDGRRTSPSARNKQEIDIYITTARGVYLYDAVKNILIGISAEDIRAKTGGQPFVKDAAVNILYVCDKGRAASSDETRRINKCSLHCRRLCAKCLPVLCFRRTWQRGARIIQRR